MTREDIIPSRTDVLRMAREAGWSFMEAGMDAQRLERFADLVAAKASAASASVEQKKWQDQTMVDIHEAVLEEREACAKLCDDMWTGYGDLGAICSSAIRARGQA